MKISFVQHLFLIFLILNVSCQNKSAGPSTALINEINLKRGDLISCGPADKQFGSLDFEISANQSIRDRFNLGTKLLHSFEYEEAEKVFASIIDEEPACAMAYWGVAMSNFHTLWTPPTENELKKGTKAIEIARSITKKSQRESDYIEAIATFYSDWQKLDHRTRCLRFEKAMEDLYVKYPKDKEAAIFYSLALNGTADPTDKTYAKQKKAGSILMSIYNDQPDHPGIIHYLIHNYDYPGLAEEALPLARRYATVAPSSAHALHMPSHIFTRLGLWDESISSNDASVYSAQCYAKAAGIKGNWDEEIHGIDYLVYAHLQKGDNDKAKKEWDYINVIHEVYPTNFKVAYAFAAIPSRYLLENRLWNEAANYKDPHPDFPWENFPWQSAIIHFTRLLGNVHLGNLEKARNELEELNSFHAKLLERKMAYEANQVQIQINAGQAWINLWEGKKEEAIKLMAAAAEMEDKTAKHPVTPCEVIPARELYADMLLQANRPAEALLMYENDLKNHPNRFNGLYGAALAAVKINDQSKAQSYYQQLVKISGNTRPQRPELSLAKTYIEKSIANNK